MDTFECIRKRRAIREFEDRDVPDDTVLRILEAGRLSPSSKNTQPWHFIVVRSKERLETLARLSPTAAHMSEASFAIAVVMDNAKLPRVDGARAGQNMISAAWELGVGSCWIANWDADEVKRLLGVPKRMFLLTVLPFGYPKAKTVKREKRRKALSEITHLERLGSPLPGSS